MNDLRRRFVALAAEVGEVEAILAPARRPLRFADLAERIAIILAKGEAEGARRVAATLGNPGRRPRRGRPLAGGRVQARRQGGSSSDAGALEEAAMVAGMARLILAARPGAAAATSGVRS